MSKLWAIALFVCAGVEDSATISEAKRDADGFLLHEVRSPYQAGATEIRVLLPDRPAKRGGYPAVYVLPVEAGTESRYGNGLKEIKRLNLHEKYGAIFIAPTFSHLPWYADHPSRPEIRQESHLLETVVPFIDKTYPVRAERDGRFLLGFSKSGWGAWSLLLRNPDRFHKAAAWDAPMMLSEPGKFGSGEIFGGLDNFERYRITRLLEARADRLRGEKRLLLLGYGGFREDHEKIHALMEKAAVAHEYRDGPARKHDWHGGWVAEAVELLLAKPSDAGAIRGAGDP